MNLTEIAVQTIQGETVSERLTLCFGATLDATAFGDSPISAATQAGIAA
jgi:hypothetical protein